MKNSENLFCNYCKNKLSEAYEFCPHCGTILIEDVKCTNHQLTEALGVCLICQVPFCGKCGEFSNKMFLCEDHSKYEIYENFARVFGSSDNLEVEYYKNALVEEGFHPIIYSRKASTLSLGGPDFSLFRASGEYDGNLINEFKLMLPLNELLEGEKIIMDLSTNDR
jgi:hypothetical protein